MNTEQLQKLSATREKFLALMNIYNAHPDGEYLETMKDILSEIDSILDEQESTEK